jgi:hypothetical protein
MIVVSREKESHLEASATMKNASYLVPRPFVTSPTHRTLEEKTH